MKALMVTILMFTSVSAYSDHLPCRANLIYRDWSGGFESEWQARNWCSTRLDWFQLPRDDFDQFCRVRWNYDQWTSLFWHPFTSVEGYNRRDVYDEIYHATSNPVFNGFRVRLQINFNDRCDEYQY